MITGAPSAPRRAQRPPRFAATRKSAARFQELLSLARPDPEEELARLIGDLPARRTGGWRAARPGWLRGARRTAGANFAEYLQEESRDLVNRTEVEEFLPRNRRLARVDGPPRCTARAAGARLQRRALMQGRGCACACCCGCWRSSGHWSVTASAISCAPRTCIGRSASSAICRRGRGSRRSAGASRGERLRLALEELGPIFVKFGQALSTRRDLLPVDIADELAQAAGPRAAVRPRDVAVAPRSRRAFGRPVGEIFASFDREPRSPRPRSHRCTRRRSKTGEEVVVKVLRPGMREVIDRDLEVLRGARRAGRRLLGGGPPAASQRGRARVPQDHHSTNST